MDSLVEDMVTKKNSVKDVRIQKAVYRGFGLGYLYSKPTFLLHAFPNEKVSARIWRKGRKVFRGEVLEVIEDPSPARRKPPCRYSGICGGCHYQEIEYSYQLQIKKDILHESLSYIGKLEDMPVIRENPSPTPLRYRPQCGFQVNCDEKKVRLGYFRFESQDFIHIDDCLLLIPDIIEVKKELEIFLTECEIARRKLQYLDIRMKSDGSRFVLTMGYNSGIPEHAPKVFEETAKTFPKLSGMLFKSWKDELVLGDGTINETVKEYDFTIGPGSFFQNNLYQWPKLQDLLYQRSDIQLSDRLLDLFCGVGFWSIGLGSLCESVSGYEFNNASVALASQNARRNGMGHYHFDSCDLSQGLPELIEEPTIAVINPPRSGCSKKLLNEFALKRPHTVIYLSCDPPSLARDIARLTRKGDYRIESIDFIDMFPQTFSIETAIVLKPR